MDIGYGRMVTILTLLRALMSMWYQAYLQCVLFRSQISVFFFILRPRHGTYIVKFVHRRYPYQIQIIHIRPRYKRTGTLSNRYRNIMLIVKYHNFQEKKEDGDSRHLNFEGVD